MKRISDFNDLAEQIRQAEHVKLYGAGLRLASFMEAMAEMGIEVRPECILVSSGRGNPDTVCGIPVVEAAGACFHDTDMILLTISDCFVEDARRTLAGCGITENVYGIDYKIIDEIPYRRVYRAVEPFLKTYPEVLSGLNLPAGEGKKYVWSCWWQGEESAPELVKKCWESQRKNLPEGVEHVIVTWENYENYMELPPYIIRKAEDGKLLPAHLADIARCCLLYKYGGIWLDSTVYLTERLPEECFQYEILTRSTGEKIYCTNVSWVTWFLGSRKGEELYRFLMEAFFYYLKGHEEMLHYYMIDFLIAAACRNLSGIEEKMKKIPVNNVNAVELQKHLGEAFDREACRAYTEGGFLQKLTYKGGAYREDSVYAHLICSVQEERETPL